MMCLCHNCGSRHIAGSTQDLQEVEPVFNAQGRLLVVFEPLPPVHWCEGCARNLPDRVRGHQTLAGLVKGMLSAAILNLHHLPDNHWSRDPFSVWAQRTSLGIKPTKLKKLGHRRQGAP